MNLHSFVASNGLVVKSEPKEITIRVFDEDNNHLFNCQVTAAGLDVARVTAGSTVNGEQFSMSIHDAINEYLMSQGFVYGILEKVSDKVGVKTTKRKLK